MIIHFNGMPGVGKLTIARQLALCLNAHILDNHALINTVYAMGYEHGSDGYLKALSDLTRLVYEELLRPDAPKDILLTNALVNESNADVERFEKVIAFAHARKQIFVPILLTCTPEENLRRAVNHERSYKQKLTNPDVLAEIHQKNYTFCHLPNSPYQITLDVTSLTPDQAVRTIFSCLQKIELSDSCAPSPSQG